MFTNTLHRKETKPLTPLSTAAKRAIKPAAVKGRALVAAKVAELRRYDTNISQDDYKTK